MYCPSCGTKNEDDSVFCIKCGKPISQTGEVSPEKNTLFDLFSEIYDSKDDKRKYYSDYMSDEVWALIKRLSTNTFESFLQENKAALNPLPYTVIENLEGKYLSATTGGYWIYLAQYLYKNPAPKKPKFVDETKIVEVFQSEIKDGEKHFKNISPELEELYNVLHNHLKTNLLQESPAIKELSLDFIETLKTELFKLMFWGYICGKSEESYRVK